MSPVIVGTMTRTRVATKNRFSSSVCVCASYGGGEEGSSVGSVEYVCFCVAIVMLSSSLNIILIELCQEAEGDLEAMMERLRY